MKIKSELVNNINVNRFLLLFCFLFSFFIAEGQSGKIELLKAFALLDQGNYSEAAIKFSALIDNGHYKERSYFLRGKAYLFNKEYNNAIADFRKNSDVNISSLWISKTYAESGNADSAMHYLKNHLLTSNKEVESKIKRDSSFKNIHETDAWFDFWQNDWYTDAEKQVSEISYQIDRKEYLVALDNIFSLMSSVAGDRELYYQRARVFNTQGNYKGALSDINFSINSDKPKTEYFLLRAKIYTNTGKYDKALEDINIVLKNNPEKAELYKERANLFYNKKDFSQALKDINLYLDLYNDDMEALLILGKTNHMKGELLEALKVYSQILKNDQSNAEYFKLRGITYFETGTYKYAISDLSMALDLNPNDGETYLYKALARYKTGEKEGACMDFQNAKFYGELKAIEYLLEYCE